MIAFLDESRTAAGSYYLSLLTTLQEKIVDLYMFKVVLFLQDNTLARKSHVWDVRFKLLKQLPHSPDLDSSNLFCPVNESLMGHQ